jgi:hypothetical protein
VKSYQRARLVPDERGKHALADSFSRFVVFSGVPEHVISGLKVQRLGT